MILRKTVLYLFFTGIVLFPASCEKETGAFSSDKLVLKSQEIVAYIYEEYNGIQNYSMVVPVKMYARGGAPEHSNGDYRFRLAEGSVLPDGLLLDSISGVIQGNGYLSKLREGSEEFQINVSDGVNTASAKCTFNRIYVNREIKINVPVMQFSSPETNLHIDLSTGSYGVSLTMLGGNPPYKFSLPYNEVLPGDLTLNPENGVISGAVKNLLPGRYTFRVKCIDSNGTSAMSMCTSQKFEEYTLIVN